MKEALRFGEQMLRALVSLHEEDAAALDLKPANLLFDSDRRDRLVVSPLDTASTLPRLQLTLTTGPVTCLETTACARHVETNFQSEPIFLKITELFGFRLHEFRTSCSWSPACHSCRIGFFHSTQKTAWMRVLHALGFPECVLASWLAFCLGLFHSFRQILGTCKKMASSMSPDPYYYS